MRQRPLLPRRAGPGQSSAAPQLRRVNVEFIWICVPGTLQLRRRGAAPQLAGPVRIEPQFESFYTNPVFVSLYLGQNVQR